MESQSQSPNVNPSIKRGPGRPPKLKSTLDPSSGDGPKKRGRPPKQLLIGAAAEVPFIEPISEAQPTEKRRPGRPPKLQEVPFAQPVAASDEGAAVKRRAGRPPKVGRMVWPVGVGRPRGRPKKSAIGLGPVSRSIGKQPRGRPRKLGGGGGVGMVTMKRRGRPPKGSSSWKPRRVSGKPLGRPRKDASAVRNQTSKHEQGVTNEELTRKLELIQLKIQDVAGIIRPYIANENEALMALQQLEEIATTALSEPPTMSIAPPPAPQSETLEVDPSPMAPTSAAPSSALGPAPVPVPGAFFGIPGTFSVNLPALNTEPFHVPSVMESQQPISWLPSGGTQS